MRAHAKTRLADAQQNVLKGYRSRAQAMAATVAASVQVAATADMETSEMRLAEMRRQLEAYKGRASDAINSIRGTLRSRLTAASEEAQRVVTEVSHPLDQNRRRSLGSYVWDTVLASQAKHSQHPSPLSWQNGDNGCKSCSKKQRRRFRRSPSLDSRLGHRLLLLARYTRQKWLRPHPSSPQGLRRRKTSTISGSWRRKCILWVITALACRRLQHQ